MKFLINWAAAARLPHPSALSWSSAKKTGLALGLCSLVVAGCSSFADLESSSVGPGGADGINDAALGVAASPRVTNRERNLPRGGGRDQIGRPYTIAGQRYVPREDRNYNRVGMASWYGPGFHGRLTANGEVYDMHTLSAAHPTLPLPSYVRVTNLSNDRAVTVRVNDRGPFSRNRIIDLSKRAADVLDMRQNGVARVRVQYLDRAPLHGQDVEWLEASARIPGQRAPIANTDIVVARAPVPAPVTPPAAVAQPRPVTASAFVATSDVTETRANAAPLDLTPTSPAPTFAPAVPGSNPNAPLPGGLVGFSPVAESGPALAAGFVQRSRDVNARRQRLSQAHNAAALGALEATQELALRQQIRTAAATSVNGVPDSASHTATFQVGVFGDPRNVARLEQELAELGEVLTGQISSGARILTNVQLRSQVSGETAASHLLNEIVRRGHGDTYIVSLQVN